MREDEVTDVNVARRLTNYSELIEEITGRLQTEGIADMDGLRPAHGYNSAGRYLRLHAKFGLWMGVDLMAWRDWSITPIWSKHNINRDFSGVEGKVRQAEKLFNDAPGRRTRFATQADRSRGRRTPRRDLSRWVVHR